MREEVVRGKRLFEKLLAANSHVSQKERAREYIVHRVHQGGRLSDVLQEEYVRSNCSQDELDEIVRDPRLIESLAFENV